MAIPIFDAKMSTASKERLTALAKEVFTDVSTLTKDHIITLVKMDMSTFIGELSVSVAITRPTEQKFATNNYHASAKLDVSGIFDIIDEELKNTDKDQLIDRYLSLKSAAYNLISAKYGSTENFLRNLVESAASKDAISPIGRNSAQD